MIVTRVSFGSFLTNNSSGGLAGSLTIQAPAALVLKTSVTGNSTVALPTSIIAMSVLFITPEVPLLAHLLR